MCLLNRSRLFVLFLVAGLASPVLASRAMAEDLVILAAASLKDALDEAAAIYRQKGGEGTKISYASSSALAKQIENAAPADIFMSADTDWMDYVDKKNLVKPGTRFNWLGNELVLVAPANSAVKVDIKPGFPLAQLLGNGRLSMGQPDSVPAGKYGKAALEKLGVWSSVEAKLAPAEDVRSALRFVSLGEAPLGIVYQTDATADKGVKIVGMFPADTHPPIIYPAAVLAASKNPGASKFLDFLRSAEARPSFEKQGFTLLK